MTGRLIDWWRRRRITKAKLGHIRTVGSMSEIGEPPRRAVAVVGTAEHPKWLVFACPCGTGHTIQLPASPTSRPRWSLSVGVSGRPSITPSIDDVRETRCHFWLRDGLVHWVHDNDHAETTG